jgi:hypothetical protein
MSSFVSLECGVRQGGVLSPHLFSIYIDDVIMHIADIFVMFVLLVRVYLCTLMT